MREEERKEMEKRELVDKPDTKKNLSDAISFIGSCTDMCPTFERVRRTFENNFKQLEKDPVTGKITRQYSVKAFSRPAAGQPPPLPSDVRPPSVLKDTLHYLIENAVPELPSAHSFLWDRTRSIRQDFTYQNYAGDEAIECNELIARIHIVSLHVMAGSDQEYSQQQELEQFNKTLQTLSEIYSERRKLGLPQAPREAEFRAYQLLSHLKDADIERQIQELPIELFESNEIQLALKLRALIQQNNNNHVRGFVFHENASNFFGLFFKLMKTEAPFLFSCLLESSFNELRFYSLKAMSRAYHARGKPYYSSRLMEMLGFDTSEDALEYCRHYDLPQVADEAEPCVDLTAWNDKNALSKTPLSQPYSKWIDQKTNGRDLKSIIYNGDDFGSVAAPPVTVKKPLLAPPVFNSQKPKEVPKSIPTQPAFSFSTTQNKPEQPIPQQTFPPATKAPAAAPSEKKPSPVFSSQPKPTTNTDQLPPSLPSSFTFPAKPPQGQSQPQESIELPKPQAESQPPPEPKKPAKFTEDELKNDTQTVIRKIIGPIIREEILPNKWNSIEQKRQEREQLLNEIGGDVFNRLVGGLVEEQSSVARAEIIDHKRLKLAAIHSIKQTALIAKERADEKRRRKEEYESVTKLLGRADSVKRRTSGRQRIHHPYREQQDQVKLIEQTRQESSIAWDPLEVKNLILPSVSRTFKNLRSFDRTVQMSFFCQDWENAITGQWLKSKLQLQWNGKSYERDIKDAQGTMVKLSALENDAEKYPTLCGLLFECGISNLEFDKAALDQVLKFIKKTNTKFKVTIILMYWGEDGDNIKDELINGSTHSLEGNEDLTMLFCSMANNSSAQLKQCLETISNNFTGELSIAGKKERDEVSREQYLASQQRKTKKEEEERIRKTKQDEERYKKMKGKNSLRLFESSQAPKEMVTGTSPTDLKRKRHEDGLSNKGQESNAYMPRGLAELKALVSEVTKKSRNE